MQQFGLALLPVLAGYWLITQTHLLKHPYERKTHHRVFFEPAVVGVGLLIVSWVLASMLAGVFESNGSLGRVGYLWRYVFPYDHTGVLALTIAFAVVIPPIINRKVGAVDAANRWALANESARGRLLRESMEKGKLVEVVLTGGQSLVGFVGTSPGFDFEGDVALAPELSGYRNPETHNAIVWFERASNPVFQPTEYHSTNCCVPCFACPYCWNELTDAIIDLCGCLDIFGGGGQADEDEDEDERRCRPCMPPVGTMMFEFHERHYRQHGTPGRNHGVPRQYSLPPL